MATVDFLFNVRIDGLWMVAGPTVFRLTTVAPVWAFIALVRWIRKRLRAR